MKSSKIQVIGSFLIIAILVVMMLYTVVCAIFQIIIKAGVSNNYINEIFGAEKSSIVEIDFSQLYPFQNTEKEVIEKNPIEKYKSIIEKAKNQIESFTSKKLLGYEKFIEYSYVYNDLISYSLVANSNNDTRIESEDGYFSWLVKKRDVTECVNRLIEFNDYLNDLNINLLYVQAPNKISQTQKISSIYKDYSNENMDNLLKAIKNKIDYIDLRENINKAKLNYLKLFYKTDHHWLPETGLWATKEISSYLNNYYEMNLKIENSNFENYNIERYPKMYLGSDGRYVSLKNAEPEDFCLLIPKFETKLNVKILDMQMNKTDTFENVLIDWSKVKYKNYYKISQYSAYLYGDRPLIEIHNEYIDNNKKILLLRDSFSAVVEPFLALENEYLSIIDLRKFSGSLKSYIHEFRPDVVVILYNANAIVDLNDSSTAMTFEDLANMWDFE